ncbi:hypothetical protein FSP39_009629 [Pinctada imbricata]|uniref:Lipocalin/cytosolic fatty-acid binding domain-containing protein n=1 Tax=Pinctada imbricata TaxID=66713 RepID=A0AA88XF48_PINIB|nr:hypothetical protein FSP39_009629 [Pinctada imbricata]
MGNLAKPTTEITVSEDGQGWNIKTITTFKTTEIDFKLGQEFDEVTADGRNVKSTVTLNGNTMTHVQKGDPESVITREFSAKRMTMVCIGLDD